MNTAVRRVGVPGLALAAVFAIARPLLAQQPAPINPAPDVAVQSRGPIHEAFAQPTDVPPQPGPIIPRQPPAPIPEAPPDEKPQADVQWIPGYWAWDDQRQDFLWVSGFWRVPPPDRRWVPGYWAQVTGGWQWVPGAWVPLGQQQLSYLPQAPPASLDNGPSVPAPNDNSMYIPGCWIYRATGYVWRPGYWSPAQPGFVWTPATYCPTPAGYLFVDGYWDYPLADRGLLFAPVCFNQPLWQNPGWVYRPSYGVAIDGLLSSLFVRPAWRHYYFGNYYGPQYARAGYLPWVSYGAGYRDGLFNYYRWAYRGNPGWYRGLVNTYRGRAAGTLPVTAGLVRPLSAFRGPGRLGLTRIGQGQIARAQRLGQLYHESGRVRAGWEAQRAGRVGRTAALPLARLPAFQGRRNGATLPGRVGRVSTPFRSGRGAVTRAPAGRVAAPGRLQGAARRVPGVSPRPAAATRRVGPMPAARRAGPRARPAAAIRGAPRRTAAARPASRPVRAAARPAPRPVRAARPAPRPAAAHARGGGRRR